MNNVDCKGCTLSISSRRNKKAAVMFIGLSAKPGTKDLCPSTNTGNLIAKIETRIETSIGIIKTNLVKCAPTDRNGKLRYPTEKEMQSCLPHLITEMQTSSPRVIVPLGGQVTRFLINNFGEGKRFSGFSSDYWYDTYPLTLATALPIHHPSYMCIYRRKQIDMYVKRVGMRISELALLR